MNAIVGILEAIYEADFLEFIRVQTGQELS